MQQVFNFVLNTSGCPIRCANSTEAGSGSTLTASYTLSYKTPPTSVNLVIEGYKNGSGDVALLDNFSASIVTTPQSRSISLGDTYDLFIVTVTFNSGAGVTVAGSLSMSGAGQVFDASSDLVNFYTQS